MTGRGLNERCAELLSAIVEQRGRHRSVEAYLSAALRTLAKWRSQLIANTLVQREGARVLDGPFAGMAYGQGATEGSLAARLLGSYESELHPAISELSRSGLEVVLDIGCAEGFYAVGLARLMPGAAVFAHDVDPVAREACAALAEANGVADRVVVGGRFAGSDFARFAGRRVLVFMDAEGAEDDLLDPDAYPWLKGMSVIVETHEGERRGVTARLLERFTPSHAIERIVQGPKTTPLPPWFAELGHLDQLLATWEWRASPTPWLVMRPHEPGRAAGLAEAGAPRAIADALRGRERQRRLVR